MREEDELSTKTTPRYKKPVVVFDKLSIQDGGQVKWWFVPAQKVQKRTCMDECRNEIPCACASRGEKNNLSCGLRHLPWRSLRTIKSSKKSQRTLRSYFCLTSSKKRTNAQAFSTCFLGNPSRKLVHYKTRDESHDTPIVRLIVLPVFILDGWSFSTDDPSPV